MQMATVLFYLTDVEEGGETVFPLEGKDGLQRLNGLNYKSCDQGLRVSFLKQICKLWLASWCVVTTGDPACSSAAKHGICKPHRISDPCLTTVALAAVAPSAKHESCSTD